MKTQSSHARATSTVRYWRATDSARPWWPWGLLPLLGLLGLFLIGMLVMAPRIQADIRSEVTAQMAAHNIQAVDVAADGQHVAVRANAAPAQVAAITAVAKTTQCDTWLGRLDCPTQVQVGVTQPVAARPTPEPARAIAAPAPRLHDFRFRKDAQGVTLAGEVPDAKQHQRIVAAARARFDRVVDQLTVSNESATPGFVAAADRAIAVLANLVRGEAHWQEGVFDVTGFARSDAAAEIESTFHATAQNLKLGVLDVQVEEGVERCNARFREALAVSSIQFRTSSTQIDDQSAALLKELAALAQQCPGGLTVAGHTDSRGDARMNLSLSEGRARSVQQALVALGVNAQRVSARGFGETQPVADNNTSQGRANNRRIEISVAELN